MTADLQVVSVVILLRNSDSYSDSGVYIYYDKTTEMEGDV